MGRCRLVRPEEVRLSLSDGDYIDVKKRLNAGEYRKLVYDQIKDAPDGEKVILDHSKVGMSRLLAYLLGWSLTGFDDQPIPYNSELPEDIRRATIDSLDQETYRELLEAVTDHANRDDRDIEVKKTAPATGGA